MQLADKKFIEKTIQFYQELAFKYYLEGKHDLAEKLAEWRFRMETELENLNKK